jgi:type II secretory pathway component PulC
MSDRGIKGRRKNILQEFFKTNKSMAVLLPVLVVAVIALVIFYSSSDSKPVSGKQNDLTQAGISGQAVEILPQMERIKKPDTESGTGKRDPFISGGYSLTLKGITLHDEKSTAIIETENRAYVVSAGDIIEDNWTIQRIDTTSVLLKTKEGNELILDYK